MKKKKRSHRRFSFAVVLAVVVAVVAIGAFLYFHTHGVPEQFALGLNFSHSADASAAAIATASNGTETVSKGRLQNTNQHYSFAIPNGFTVGRTESATGETLLVQSKDGTKGIQIYISAFNDPGSSITASRVKSEAGLTISNASAITVAHVAQGLVFDDDSSNPSQRDAWFSYNGTLYQVSTWKSDASLLNTLLASWQFSS